MKRGRDGIQCRDVLLTVLIPLLLLTTRSLHLHLLWLPFLPLPSHRTCTSSSSSALVPIRCDIIVVIIIPAVVTVPSGVVFPVCTLDLTADCALLVCMRQLVMTGTRLLVM
jgi:hypothetical protein